jgi:hypothetical protein
MAWFSLPVDPKAGEWKHEILARAVYTVASSCVLAPILYLVELNLEMKTQEVLIMVAFLTSVLLLFALPEAFLRRTWKMVVLIPALGWVVCLALSLVPSEDISSTNSKIVPFLLLGGFVGLISGFASRCLLASVFALFWGTLGALPFKAFFEWYCDSANWFSDAPVVEMICLFTMLSLPIALTTDISIWAGMALARKWGRLAPAE